MTSALAPTMESSLHHSVGGKKTRQRWRVFGCVYSAAYCLFAQLHAANARQNADQLPHHPADSIVGLSAKPGRVFCFIFLYSLVSEQVLDSLILPSPFLNVFLFFTPPIGIFPITSKSSPPLKSDPLSPSRFSCVFIIPPNTPIRGRPKPHCEYKKERKRKTQERAYEKTLFFLFCAAQELAAEMVSKEDFKSGGLLRNASLGDTRTFALY